MSRGSLPGIPSALIRLALKDLEKAERDPRFRVDMEKAWFKPEEGGKCAVCFAGAVLAGTLGADPEEGGKWTRAFHRNRRELWALDEFRRGETQRGCAMLDLPFTLPNIPEVRYDEDPEVFKAWMGRMADEFRARGV